MKLSYIGLVLAAAASSVSTTVAQVSTPSPTTDTLAPPTNPPTNPPTKNPTAAPTTSAPKIVAAIVVPTVVEGVPPVEVIAEPPANATPEQQQEYEAAVEEAETESATLIANTVTQMIEVSEGSTITEVCTISIGEYIFDPKRCVETTDDTRRLLASIQEDEHPHEMKIVKRHLQTDDTVVFELIIEQLCDASAGCGDNAQSLASELQEEVSESWDGNKDSFAAILVEEAAAVLNITIDVNDIDLGDTVFQAPVVEVQEPAVPPPVQETDGPWYPTWKVGSFCSNDGNQPLYMKKNPTAWLYSDREGCCNRYYNYDLAGCLGTSAVALGFYPDWKTTGSVKCLNDTNIPEHMRSNPTQWVYDDIPNCCERYYSWDLSKCVSDSTAAAGGDVDAIAAAAASNDWYVNFEDEKCVQDCIGSAPCGGLAEPWEKPLFTTKSACCSEKLYWLDQSECIAN